MWKSRTVQRFPSVGGNRSDDFHRRVISTALRHEQPSRVVCRGLAVTTFTAERRARCATGQWPVSPKALPISEITGPASLSAGYPTILDEARSAYRAGLCILPAACDGTKRPDVPTWTGYQTARPTAAADASLPLRAAHGLRHDRGPRQRPPCSLGFRLPRYLRARSWRRLTPAGSASSCDGSRPATATKHRAAGGAGSCTIRRPSRGAMRPWRAGQAAMASRPSRR